MGTKNKDPNRNISNLAIVVVHLVLSALSIVFISFGVLLFYKLSTRVVTNVLFGAAAICLLTIFISSIVYLIPIFKKINRVLAIGVRYFWLLLPFLGMFWRDFCNNLCLDSFEMISSLIPMIFTIIVVTLSRMNDKVCGIDSHDFRRLRRDNHFALTEMIIIGIVLFAVGTIFRLVPGFKFSLFVTYVIGVIYSVWFIIQEIPLITKNRKFTNCIAVKIVRWFSELNEGDQNQIDIRDIKLIRKIEAYLVYMNGLKGAYSHIKKK